MNDTQPNSRFYNVITMVFLVGVLAVVPQIGSAKTNVLPSNYPRVANYFLDSKVSKESAEALARWDLAILDLESSYTSKENLELIKERNPDSILLVYVPSEELAVKHLSVTDEHNPVYKLYHPFLEHDDWFLKNTSNQYLNFWPDTRIINVTSEWKSVLPEFVTNEVLNNSVWDGVFYDNCFNDISWVGDNIDMNNDDQADLWQDVDAQWKGGMTEIMRRTRELNPHKLIVCNSNGKYYTYINGRLIEAFPGSKPEAGWKVAMGNYFKVLQEAKQPSVVVVNTVNNSNDAKNYRLMRYNLTSTLLGDGFASFDESVSMHHSLWWYDEYDTALGGPLDKAYNVLKPSQTSDNISTGVWRRNFANGIVLVNTTEQSHKVRLEEGFEKILGTQDTTVNNGKVVGSVTIPANDGVILRGRITQVSDAPFTNGTFAKVFDDSGNLKRNSFFSYNSNYAGGTTVQTVPGKNSTIVGDDTYISIYTNGKRTARFAPYGTQYAGGVNIAVGRFIVVGPKQGAQPVKLFSLTGKLLNAGSYPFGKTFSGGINVAIGNVITKTKAAEIVVAPASNYAPEVRILTKTMKLLPKKILAYNTTMRSGVSVAVGDINNNGRAEIVTVPGKGGAPYVKVFNSKGRLLRPGFYAFDKADRNGSSVAVSDIDADGVNDLVVMSFNIFSL